MPKFPKEETKIIELAQLVANGIGKNAGTFANPPVTAAALEAELTEYFEKIDEVQDAKAAVRNKTQEKNDILDRIAEATRDNIDYAELVAKGDAAVLEKIGWSPRAAPSALQVPGQCRAFEIVGQGASFVRFDWKEPAGGGKAAAYKVQRSEDGVNFTDAFTAVESEAALFNQPTGKKLIYQVVAINKAGEGLPSNTVTIAF